MKNNKKYDYGKAEADLYDVGARFPEDVYEYSSEKSFRSHMKEYGLNPDRYLKPEKKNTSYGSGRSSGSSNSSGGCYLTTACVVSKGLPDDCDELQTLRAFRDSYLAAQPNGQSEIEAYYRMAPGIVDAVNRMENHKEIWNQVYMELIVPCVCMIHAQENAAAHRLYRAYSMELHRKYC